MVSASDARARFLRLSQPVRAALVMLAAIVVFSFMSLFIRLAAEGVHVLVVVFFRNFLAVLMLAPLAMRRSARAFRSQKIGLHALRAVNGALAMAASFTAITLIPLADATALGFAAPMFATLGAALILRERIRLHRTLALAVGFVGVLVVLRPGADAVSFGAGLALLGAALLGLATVFVKKLTATETPEAIAFWMVAMQAPLSLPPALLVWSWPDATTFLYLVALAGVGTVGHLLWARATAMAEVTQLQPIEFVKLPILALIGWLVFSETPDAAVWIGGAVIFAATAAITHREARLARKGVVDPRPILPRAPG